MLNKAIKRIDTDAEEYSNLKALSLEEFGLGVDHLREWLAEAYAAGAYSKGANEFAAWTTKEPFELSQGRHNIRKFYDFMQAHKAWLGYVNNRRLEPEGGIVQLYTENPAVWVCHAFLWCDSVEDYDYWDNIDTLWRTTLNE